MKYYQYITKEKASPEEELWVCEGCRKLNSNLILEGKWRLIGKIENGDMTCDECQRGEQQQQATENGQDDLPYSAASDSQAQTSGEPL